MSTPPESDGTRRLIVVGAGHAGLRAAEAARRAGFSGELAIIGAERHEPYDRPTLSKGALLAEPDRATLRLPVPAPLSDVRWHLGRRVQAADLDARTVLLDDGSRLRWDGLVLATGLRPRRLDLPGPTEGPLTLRDLDDSTRLRLALASAAAGHGRVVVVGAGFVGCEVAYAAASLGLDVTVVAPEAVPLQQALGDELGRSLRERHEALGVRFRLGTVPVGYDGEHRIGTVITSDGDRLPADVVVEAVGSEPVVEFLDGQGADLADGVAVDGQLRVTTDPKGESRPDVVACGDIARFVNPLFDDIPRRIEHWTLAADTGKRAGRTVGLHLAGASADERTFAPVPTFWSEQCGVRLQSFGLPALGTADARVLEGDLQGEVVVGYHRDDRLIGVVMIGFETRYRDYRMALAARGSQPEQAGPGDKAPVSGG